MSDTYVSTKYNSAEAEALDDMASDGTYPTTGDVESPIGHVTMVDMTFGGWWVGDNRATFIPSGGYIVTCDSQGFVDAEHYATYDEAMIAFNELDREYGQWLDTVEGDV